MIKVTDLNDLLTEMVADISAVTGHVLVANENHLVKRLSDKRGIWLAVTIPSADDESGNEDSIAESNVVWMFALEKIDPGSLSQTKELEHYQKIQDVITDVKNWLRDQKLDGNEFLEYLNLNSIHTDPEYQVGGWNGWSINFNFETEGF